MCVQVGVKVWCAGRRDQIRSSSWDQGQAGGTRKAKGTQAGSVRGTHLQGKAAHSKKGKGR